MPHGSFDYSKFRTTKDFLIALEFDEFTHEKATGQNPGGMKLLRELFAQFFGPKKLLGYKKRNQEFLVAVHTEFGEHDLDLLSSGEKELFSIFVNLFKIRNLPSVILYDEPERHLNPGLESKIIPALDKLQSKNQLWIATHGAELISSVAMKDIVGLRPSGSQIHVERFNEDLKAARVRLFESIGARVGLQLASNRIVFLEGENSHADQRILDRLAGATLPGVLFVVSGSSAGVTGSGTRAMAVLEAASKDAAFLMILDRDYRTAAEVAVVEKRLQGRAYVWKCHELENILLHPTAVREVLSNSGITTLKTPGQVLNALKESAKKQESLFISQWTAYRIYRSAFSEDEVSIRPTDEASVRLLVEANRKRSTKAFSDETFTTTLTEATREVRLCLGSDRWITELPGKEILEAFRREHVPSIESETFKEQIVSAMIRLEIVPGEIANVCKFITAH